MVEQLKLLLDAARTRLDAARENWDSETGDGWGEYSRAKSLVYQLNCALVVAEEIEAAKK